ncbi:putative acyl-CoA-binding protein-like protein [Hapsidospora chrysogenum ATCC 11550]|uniref:Putative acyl-CoA-binding protein-like protein n=1 Tax=Hapsidospora chrysogenum (strain ATCC 11550 / CBS 779.69 / DSM 880 / IAM 14645 / JCM 23072 / IMI 49137) TaxID=857340 RepID=A0A086STN7_HAPC1|nr:putative acyl-CoA-binding protein-like protein [Hapsidospora chrysogenum ATCC 11550]
MAQSEAFQTAVTDSKKLTAKPDNDELLKLYALYKVALGLLHTGKQGKAKKNAWQKVVDEGTTPEQAQEQYVALVEELKAKHGYDANKEPEAVGGAA